MSDADLPDDPYARPYTEAYPALSVGAAIRYGWNRFQANAMTWIGIVLVAILVQVVLNFLVGGRSSLGIGPATTEPAFSLGASLGDLVSVVVGYLINAALVRGSLDEVSGRRPSIASFFTFTNVGTVVLASILVGVLTGIGLILLVIPGLVVAFLSAWTLHFIIDRDESAVAALRSSFRAISAHAAKIFLLALAVIGLNILGAILVGLGLLITIPVSVIASTYAYRVVTGGPVAP